MDGASPGRSPEQRASSLRRLASGARHASWRLLRGGAAFALVGAVAVPGLLLVAVPMLAAGGAAFGLAGWASGRADALTAAPAPSTGDAGSPAPVAPAGGAALGAALTLGGAAAPQQPPVVRGGGHELR